MNATIAWVLRLLAILAIVVGVTQLMSLFQPKGWEPVNTVGIYQTQTVIWTVATVGTLILLARVRTWPALLMLIGSAAHLFESANDLFFDLAVVRRNWIAFDSPIWQHWSLNVLENSAGVATILLPLGLLFYALGLKRSI
jgi:hypothetical protein